MKTTEPSVRNSRLPVIRLAVVSLLALLALPGCAVLKPLDFASLNPFDFIKEKYKKADAQHPAIEMLAIWQEAEGPGLNNIPTRGFSGQIFFFTRNCSQPVLVDGKTRIYLFDDHGTAKEQGRPIHIFDFEPLAWAAHLYPSNMGPSYAVFIPYTRDDIHQTSCALRIRFTPTTGSAIFSPLSTVVLNGPPSRPPVEGENSAASLDTRKHGSKNLNTSLTVPSRPSLGAAQTTPANALSVAEISLGHNPLPGAGTADQLSLRPANSRNVVLAAGTDSDRQLSLDNDGPSPAAGDALRELSASLTPPRASGSIKLQPAGTDSDDDTPAIPDRPSVNTTADGPLKRHPLAD